MSPHLRLLFVVAVAFSYTGCATSTSKSSIVDYKQRAAQLARELKRKNAQIETLREKNHVLSSRVQRAKPTMVQRPEIVEARRDKETVWKFPPGSFGQSVAEQRGEKPKSQPGAQSAIEPTQVVNSIVSSLDGPVVGADLPLVVLPKTLPAKGKMTNASGWVRPPKPEPGSVNPPAPLTSLAARTAETDVKMEMEVKTEVVKPRRGTETGESLLYGKVMSSYKRRDPEQLRSAVRLFLKSYPKSVYADNALYLEGLSAVEAKDWPNAQKSLGKLLRLYPDGNKAVSALFARAFVLRSQGDFSGARSHLTKVIRDYPGSPEAARAALEQSLISQLEKTGRTE